MASYPNSIVSFSVPQGTQKLNAPDHTSMHVSENAEIVAIENTLGTTGATNLLKFIDGPGEFAVSQDTNNALIDPVTGGTINNVVMGTPSITGGTVTGGLVQGTSNLSSGTVNLSVGTITTLTTGSITNSGTVNGISFGVSIAPGVGTITDSAGGTLTVNAQQGQVYYSVMGTAAGNRTIGTPLNPTGYQQLTYAFKTSGSANGTLVWPSIFRISQDSGTPTLGTGVGWNYFGWRYNPIDTKWDMIGQSKNLI